MKRDVLTIDRDGKVTIPANVQMTDFEIAELFGVFAPKIKANIRSLLKSNICPGDYSNGGVTCTKIALEKRMIKNLKK